MRSVGPVLLTLACASLSFAAGGDKKQTDNRVPVKMQIHHADPWAVKAMIEGGTISQPELSTIWGVRGGAGGQAGAPGQNKSPLLQDGFLVVNPTDNSLWWFPKKQ